MATTTQPQTGAKPATSLSNEEILRYSRHLIMPEVGMAGQLKLKNAKVLLIGTGGLGAPLGLYLAAAGVGRLGLVDFDIVDFTNLQRQVTFGSDDVGKPKTEAARARLRNLNPDIQIDTFETKLTSDNALALFKDPAAGIVQTPQHFFNPDPIQSNLAISEVFHKTFIAVDEKGTEAAAATAVAMLAMARMQPPPPKPIEIKVDHPFFYAIQHVPSGACLFIGRVTDPR